MLTMRRDLRALCVLVVSDYDRSYRFDHVVDRAKRHIRVLDLDLNMELWNPALGMELVPLQQFVRLNLVALQVADLLVGLLVPHPALVVLVAD